MSQNRDPASLTISNGDTTSTALQSQATRGSFTLPAALTQATLTIQVSNDGTNYSTCPIEGNEVNPVTFAANAVMSFPVKAFNFKYIRFLAPGAEGANRTITIFTRDN